ncbi:MAG: Mur ligase family protein [bacterium]|nr:Mur ligase family protein [bacterium]
MFLITSILFFIWIIKNIFFWVSLWQIKEYRFDRLMLHFRETLQGKNLFFSPLLFLKWIGIIGYIPVILNRSLTFSYDVFVLSIFTLQILITLREVFERGIRRPAFTLKALFIIGLTFSILLLLLGFPLLDSFVWLLILDRLVPLFIFIFVTSFSLPTEFYYDIAISRGTKKIKARNDLVVIGVTGSYGKSSTKEYIAQILAKKFRVLKTQGTNNTPIGIARTIQEGLRKNTEIFVVEMGAYKRGEIAYMCQIVHPTIGVLTAVSDQHLSLFGSLENTREAKYELIQALPKDGLGLFNGNNKIAYDLYKHALRRKILYKTSDSFVRVGADIFAYNIIPRKTHIAFDVVMKKRTMHLIAPLIGAQNVENILPGIFIGKSLGMTETDIKKAVSLLSPLPKTMNRHEFSNGLTIIDDTFNANPEAVIAAVSYMKLYKGKRILVLQPMIELGKNTKEEHYRIGKEASAVCDYLFLTNKNFYEEVLEGARNGKGKSIVQVGSPKKISQFINGETTKGDVVVFEGKEAGFVLDAIL